jgi:hypothetical protein
MKLKGSLPHSQEPATSPYSKPGQCSPCLLIPLEDPVHYYPPIYAYILQVTSFHQVFHTKTLYAGLLSPMRARCLAHLILLDFVARITGEEYISERSLLHSPVA